MIHMLLTYKVKYVQLIMRRRKEIIHCPTKMCPCAAIKQLVLVLFNAQFYITVRINNGDEL